METGDLEHQPRLLGDKAETAMRTPHRSAADTLLQSIDLAVAFTA